MDPTPNTNIKTIEIKNKKQKLIVKIQIIKSNLFALLYRDSSLIYESLMSLPKIQCQIGAFIEYDINEIYEEINLLKNNDFILIKEKDKYILTIKFTSFRKKKNLIIELKPKNSILNDDLINEIIKLKEIIKIKNDEINYLKIVNQK